VCYSWRDAEEWVLVSKGDRQPEVIAIRAEETRQGILDPQQEDHSHTG